MTRALNWLRWLLSGGLILYLALSVDAGEMGAALRRGNFGLLLIALLVALADRFLMAFKWNLLVRVKGVHLPYLSVVGTYWISTFLGIFLPATVGGDAVRAYAVTRDGHEAADVISSIVVERLLGFIAVFALVCGAAVLTVFVFGQDFLAGHWSIVWLFGALLLGSTLAVYVSLSPTVLRRARRLFERLGLDPDRSRVVAKLAGVYRSYAAYQQHPGVLATFAGLSFLENLFPVFWTYFLALAFGIDVPLLYFFILVPIVLVLVRLPISLDGFGIHEGAFVFFLGLVGVPAAEAFLLGLASHLLALLSYLPGGVLYAMRGLSAGSKGSVDGTREPPARRRGGVV